MTIQFLTETPVVGKGWFDSEGNEGQGDSFTFLVEGPTAALVDPPAAGAIDVAALNRRNYLDVEFPEAPAGFNLDRGSITDLDPEFKLGGEGLGDVQLDDETTRRPCRSVVRPAGPSATGSAAPSPRERSA